MSIRVFAPAKINLTLQVGRRRVDGMHPIQSVVAFADAGDWIEAAESDKLSLTLRGAFAHELEHEDENNLVIRAARALAKGAGVPAKAALTLDKQLPIASGIGGGSSDAAATLKALNALWRLGLSEAELAEIGRPLGSDVPMCVAARAVYATGAGDACEPIELPKLHALLVNPRAPLSTAAVYKEFDAMNGGGAFAPAPAPQWKRPEDVWRGVQTIRNDLYPAALALLPSSAALYHNIATDKRTRCSSLSGSGATYFALTESRQEALNLGADISWLHPECWVRECVLDAAAPAR